MMMCHQTKFSCKRIRSSEDILESCILIMWDNKPIFRKTIWLIMMHHHTKFGSERFSDSEDIIWTNINILTLRCDLDPECSNPTFFHRTLWLVMMYQQTKFGCQGINSSEDVVERVIF